MKLTEKQIRKKESLAAKAWSRIKPKPVAVKGVRVGKTGRIRLSGDAMFGLRNKVYLRDRGVCQLKLDGCWIFAQFDRGHLCHIVSRGAGGSDTPENTRWGCPGCHMKEHNGGKPCPKRRILSAEAHNE